jgi:Enoyl-(Acyl carrier protein) reductase
VAVNNAGTEGHPGPVTEQTPESYAAVFDTNVLGTLLGMKHEMRVMAAQGGGSIVNLSSVLGKVGAPGAAVYTASKHAVEGLTKAAALEGASSGVRVNAVAPGPVETEMLNRFTGGGEGKTNFLETVPVKRAGTPEEIADTIVFLACKAPFLTGQLSYCKTSPSDTAPNPRSEASARHSPSAASRTRGMAAGVVAPLPEAERVRAPRRAHARRGLLARHQTVRTSLKAGRTRIRMTGIVLIQHDADRRIKRRRQPMPGHKRGGYWIANFVLKRVTRFACDR